MAFSVWRLLSTDILPLLIHPLSIAFMQGPPRSVGRVQGPELEFRLCSGKLDYFFCWSASTAGPLFLCRVRPRSSKKGLAAIEPQTCFRTDLFSSLATHRRCTCVSSLCSLLSACGRCSLCSSSCLDIPSLFQNLQSMPFIPDLPSSKDKQARLHRVSRACSYRARTPRLHRVFWQDKKHTTQNHDSQATLRSANKTIASYKITAPRFLVKSQPPGFSIPQNTLRQYKTGPYSSTRVLRFYTITLYAVHPTLKLTLHTFYTWHPTPWTSPPPHFTVSNGTVAGEEYTRLLQ